MGVIVSVDDRVHAQIEKASATQTPIQVQIDGLELRTVSRGVRLDVRQDRFCRLPGDFFSRSRRNPLAKIRLPAVKLLHPRGCSSVGRAPALQAGGRRFEPVHLHFH